MAIKLDQKCTRCHRDTLVEVASAAEAVATEEAVKARDERSVEIEKFLAAIPEAQLPDLIVYVKGQGVIHTSLCNPTEGRSCLQRVSDLAEQMNQLDERKPRSKKAKVEVVEEEVVASPPVEIKSAKKHAAA